MTIIFLSAVIFLFSIIIFIEILNKNYKHKLYLERLSKFNLVKININNIKVPENVISKSLSLLKSKNILISKQLRNDLIDGFKDFLIINAYNFYVLQKNNGVPMISDSVDMLWHAWLEEDNYHDFFKNLLGFNLNHVPETDFEKINKLKGENSLNFLEEKPTPNSIWNYSLAKISLSHNNKSPNNSPLYNLDRSINNQHGFFYTPLILESLLAVSLTESFILNKDISKSTSSCSSCNSMIDFVSDTSSSDSSSSDSHHSCSSSCSSCSSCSS